MRRWRRWHEAARYWWPQRASFHRTHAAKVSACPGFPANLSSVYTQDSIVAMGDNINYSEWRMARVSGLPRPRVAGADWDVEPEDP